ncbi:unnamed protein product [Arctogadus glacialis]
MKPPGTTKPLVTQNDLYRLLNLLTHSSPLTDPLVSVKWIHPRIVDQPTVHREHAPLMEAHLWSRDECGAAASLRWSVDAAAAAAARANAPHPIGWGGLKWEQEVGRGGGGKARASAEEGLAEPQAGVLPLEALRPAELIYLDPGSGEGACGRQHIGIYSHLRAVTLLAVTVSGYGNLRLLEEEEEGVVMVVVVVVVEVVVVVVVVVVRSPTGGKQEVETGGGPEPPK